MCFISIVFTGLHAAASNNSVTPLIGTYGNKHSWLLTLESVVSHGFKIWHHLWTLAVSICLNKMHSITSNSNSGNWSHRVSLKRVQAAGADMVSLYIHPVMLQLRACIFLSPLVVRACACVCIFNLLTEIGAGWSVSRGETRKLVCTWFTELALR